MVARGRVAQGLGHVSVENAAFGNAVASRPKAKRAFEVAFILKSGPSAKGPTTQRQDRQRKLRQGIYNRRILSQCNRLMAKIGTMRTLISRNSTRCRTRT